VWKEGTTRLDIDIVGASKMWIQIVDERDEVGARLPNPPFPISRIEVRAVMSKMRDGKK
jgi:hypothetical protein